MFACCLALRGSFLGHFAGNGGAVRTGTYFESPEGTVTVCPDLTHPDVLSYSRPGPRYTSYPPANRFYDRFDEMDVKRAWRDAMTTSPHEDEGARQSTAVTRPLSVYVHVPYCQTLCWYCACNVKVSRNRTRGTSLVDAVLAEARLLASHVSPREPPKKTQKVTPPTHVCRRLF